MNRSQPSSCACGGPIGNADRGAAHAGPRHCALQGISGKLTRFLARNGVSASDRRTGAADIAERVAAPSRCPIIGQLTKLQCEGAPWPPAAPGPAGKNAIKTLYAIETLAPWRTFRVNK